MKLAHLTPGDDYLHNTDPDWRTRGYGNERVTLVSSQRVSTDGPFITNSRARDFTLHDHTIVTLRGVTADSAGMKVLVRFHDGQHAGQVKAVTLTSLRGEWLEAKAEADDATAEQARRRAEVANLHRDHRDRVLRASAQLVELGLVTEHRVHSPQLGEVALPLAALEALITMARNA